MKKRKRPCEVDSRRLEGKGCEHLVGKYFKGIFHKWGTEIISKGIDGVISGTVGIVEDENGQIHTVNPEYIKFTDK